MLASKEVEMRETTSELHRRIAPADDEISRAMSEMPYGLYIIGSRAGDEVNGMMADWVMQVSFAPRLIAVAIENDARTL
ncbi:MAG: flavin reductase, partial [Dehalococcoidia bacterium]